MPQQAGSPARPDGWLQQAWRERHSPLALALLPLAAVYAAGAGVHRLLYRLGIRRVQRLPVPVIVVGNVVAGGAGKTPVVMALVHHLRGLGMQPGVISRGYGRRSRGVREVLPDADPADSGDEPLLIARGAGVPVVVAERRADAGRALLARHPHIDVLVCDDGLQHAGLARDIEICVFDERGLGNGWHLPAGPLREPWPRPVARSVDLVLHPAHGRPIPGLLPANAYPMQRRLAPQARQADGTKISLGELAQRPSLVAVAGIGQPSAFFDMLAQAGCTPGQALALPDHHPYFQPPPVPARATLICTEKDAVKLWRHRPDAWAVPLELELPRAFWLALEQRLRAGLSSADGSQTA
jgi:tetraacyldisaccharide 4'-kinase